TMPPRRRAESVLSTLAVSAADERRYQQILPLSDAPVASVAAGLGIARAEVSDVRSGLVSHGIVTIEHGHVTALRAAEVLSAAITREAASVDRVHVRLDELARAVPMLVGARSRPGPGEVDDV